MTAEDELLVVRSLLGERAALEALIARWHEPVWRYARRLTASDDRANDAAQDIWVRVLRSLPRLREPARFHVWLFAIARRTLMDRFRDTYRQPSMSALDDDLAVDASGEDPRAEELAALPGLLATLPPLERETLLLFYLQELPLADVAYIQQVPLGTAKSRLFRARKLLRERYRAFTSGAQS